MGRKKHGIYAGPRHVLTRLAEVVEVCDDLADQLDNLSVAVDDIKQTLGDLAQTKPDLNALLPRLRPKGRNAAAPPAGPPRHPSAVTLAWKAATAAVLIDGKAVYLPPSLGLLMEALLAEEPGPSGAPIREGWHARHDLRLRLSDRTGNTVSRHALDNLIFRLRKELQLQARLGDILQTDRHRGVRIALEKYSLPAGADPATQLPAPG